MSWMSTLVLQTDRLQLILDSTETVLARIDAMSAEDRAQVSPDWIARMRATPTPSPWTHFFAMVERATGEVVGSCGFKGAPTADGVVEIAYAVEPDRQRRGYAREAAAALVGYALQQDQVRTVRAHTLPEPNASTRVLTACGFQRVGEVMDPEDGLVWRWDRPAPDTR
jgi:[ribosomal protein S5]-alanine N-acetyltransferase